MSREKFTFGKPGSCWAGVVRYAPGHEPAGYAELSPTEQVARLVKDVIETLPPDDDGAEFWTVRNVVYTRDGLAVGACRPLGPPGPPGPFAEVTKQEGPDS